MDHPSETSLCTVAPSPQTPLLRFFSEGRGRLYTGYLERIIPSSNCPSKLTDKVRRIVHSKLKLFHFQIKTYYLSDENYQTDNLSHADNPSLEVKTAISVYASPRSRVRRSGVCFCFFTKIIFKLTVDISMCKIILEVEYFIKSMIFQMLEFFKRIAYLIPR